MSGLQYFLDRLKNLIPPNPPTSGLALARLAAYAEFLGAQAPLNGMTTQDMQAQNLESATALGATVLNPGTPTQTVTPTAYGASGMGLDLWGQIYGVPRNQTESDGAYAQRIVFNAIQPSTVSKVLGKALDAFFSVSGTVVTDASISQFPQFNNGLRACNGVQCYGFDANFGNGFGGINVAFPSGALSVSTEARFNNGLQCNNGVQCMGGGALFVLPATGGGPVIALVEKALFNKKAAGVRVVTVTG